MCVCVYVGVGVGVGVGGGGQWPSQHIWTPGDEESQKSFEDFR